MAKTERKRGVQEIWAMERARVELQWTDPLRPMERVRCTGARTELSPSRSPCSRPALGGGAAPSFHENPIPTWLVYFSFAECWELTIPWGSTKPPRTFHYPKPPSFLAVPPTEPLSFPFFLSPLTFSRSRLNSLNWDLRHSSLLFSQELSLFP